MVDNIPDNRTYLITGATGFIGSCLLRRLLGKNRKVHILLRKEANLWRIKDIFNKITCHISDLSNPETLSEVILKIGIV